ncbi:MAG: tRNA (adenosine(37)-N6)-threonylcarbamoyltransferase complex transferase subunit TsaD [Alphaproteobacteria bacterium]|nr:tRNA (adenosine(37)-N6)-threonylcarbamoyltransferase complex transferase subunit TsaD [Alphaproteobacteria bacterium]
MRVLGLETSCDETAVGIVDDGHTVLANEVATQLAAHQPYGGVVPEVAARAHLDVIDELVRRALATAGLTLADIDGIAATCGPGLIGGVMVGAMTGKALAAVRKLPFMAVNHLEAHALTPRLTDRVAFPYLLLLVSGGHTQLLRVDGVGQYRKLGGTIDDAVGECFDKGAKMLGLGYPGGPLLEQAALRETTLPFPELPRPMLGRAGCDFSFSGLKTALRQVIDKAGRAAASPDFVTAAARAYQAAIADILSDRARNALAIIGEDNSSPVTALVVAGGVAANQAVRARLTETAADFGLGFVAPPIALCTDNGAMVAWAGLERLRLGLTDPLDTAARPRWPLAAGDT